MAKKKRTFRNWEEVKKTFFPNMKKNKCPFCNGTGQEKSIWEKEDTKEDSS